MNRIYSIVALLLLLSCSPANAQPANNHDQDVPVAPLPAVTFKGWTNAFRLANGQLEVVVVPDTGRIAFIGWEGKENLLRLDEGLAGKTAGSKDDGKWYNFGGDWLWPVAQSRWKDFQGGEWPPSRLLDGRPWSARAWKCADGTTCCLLSQTYGTPLHLAVDRLVRLPPDRAILTIRQDIERMKESDIPISLWNISQVGGAERVVLPVDTDSAFDGGTRPLMFAAPGTNVVSRHGRMIVYDATVPGESKLCGDSKRAWIAAQKGRSVLIERATTSEGTYPDGGCTIEMYANTGLGYCEIETLSVEKNLNVGETLENTLTIRCHRLPDEITSSVGLAQALRQWLGEGAE